MSVFNYATLAQTKTYLGISGSSEDTLLQQLLDSAYYTLNNLLGVSSMNLSTITEQIDCRELYHNVGYYGYNILLGSKPVNTITTINGTAYTGVKGTDYLVVYDRKVVVKDLDTYINSLDRNYFDIIYTAGYDRDNVKYLDASAAIDNGDGTVGIPCADHGIVATDSITIAGTVNYDGTYTPSDIDSDDVFSITASYAAETFEATDTVTNNTTPGTDDELPGDLKLLQMMLVGGLYNTKGSQGIKSYKLGEESITFGTLNGQSADETFFSFKTILDKYKTFILP